MSASHVSTEPLHGGCVGLAADAVWDSAAALRGELYGSEHLVEHAQELARAHGAPVLQRTPGPLRKRCREARDQVRASYQLLLEAQRERPGHEPSPAEEWLLDNSHVVDEQIREIREDLPRGYLVRLPRIGQGAMRGYPRVYGLCLDYLRHTDARVDLASLAEYVRAYQRVSPLSIGEGWAVPIMLRLGLLLIVGCLATTEASAKDREAADAWASKLVGASSSPAELSKLVSELERRGGELSPEFLVRLAKRLREHDAPLGPAGDWLHRRCELLGSSLEELTRREHLRQAADQVSVGNAITSMRAIAALDWTRFFEDVNVVEQELRQDPAAAYAQMDRRSRDRYRHVVERLARRCSASELEVAQRAIALSAGAPETGHGVPLRHVGYYLIDAGQRELERGVGYRAPFTERARRLIRGHAALLYLSGLGAMTAAACLLYLAALAPAQIGPALWLLLALLVIPASELALSLLNALVIWAFPPRLLPKLDFDAGIPERHRTLVVVPALLTSRETLRELLEDLEVRALANPDPNLDFALLTDFADAREAERSEDRLLLEEALAGVDLLNRRLEPAAPRFFLLHRRRSYNAADQCWMGWERKRGKLEELNRVLRGATDTTFSVITAPAELLQRVRYVLTLDADTALPHQTARRLVGALAHPLNRPVVDAARRRVIRGYGVIQPRVGTLPESARRTRFARLFALSSGIDPYTTAVSDVYQDLFDEGSFVGKAIYDVDAFSAVLAERVPEQQLLSHDLFEGMFARAALATDVELLDEQPASYEVAAARQHRWLRGDWQLLPWLRRQVPLRGGKRHKNDLRALDVWKLLDNLRRSLLPPSLVAFLVGSWLWGPRAAALSCLIAALVFFGPACFRWLIEMARLKTAPGSRLTGSANVPQSLLQALAGLSLLLDQALLCCDAIVRALHRQLISRRRLLEWTTAQAVARDSSNGSSVSKRVAASAWMALLFGLSLLALRPDSLAWAAPLLLAWAAAPLLVQLLRRPLEKERPLSRVDALGRRKLRLVAAKTWRFFETFVTAQDSWLPPDNFQQEPRGMVAHRTSPTNIGLYLLSVVTARDLGLITARESLARVGRTLATLARMERRLGHILNWYDTTTLQPLEPQYVSTVDSGNLVAYLWTLHQACQELPGVPLAGPETLLVAEEALELAVLASRAESSGTALAVRELERLRSELVQESPQMLDGALASYRRLTRFAPRLEALARSAKVGAPGPEVRYWLERAARVLAEGLAQLDELAPCLGWLARTPSVTAGTNLLATEAMQALSRARSVVELEQAAAGVLARLHEMQPAVSASDEGVALAELLRQTGEQCAAFRERAGELAGAALSLGDEMDFRFLYDSERELFSIGYNVSGSRLDAAHYDLLASEARLASLVAIAKGDAPVEHWWKLSRPRAQSSAGRVLLSWSGSMFEYLMPLLVTPLNAGTLLWETCRSALERQRVYGLERGVPWGVSESAYNVMDLGMSYQYRAFGVPGLGLKSGLAEDLVVAPYATVLGALLRPDLALENLSALELQGLDGPYGYYEAIDYTRAHVPPGRRGVVVKAFMAHHQGMLLVALGNLLCGEQMPRRFCADARVKAGSLLLEEQIPRTVATTEMSERTAVHVKAEPELRLEERTGLDQGPLPRLHLLGYGDLSSIVGSDGMGVTTWQGLDVTRFREDERVEPCGTLVYVRDLTRQRFWSAGSRPCAAVPQEYGAAFFIDRVEIKRRDGEIETTLEVAVSPEHTVEVRRVTLSNRGRHARELEVTTYCEPVLAPRAADVAHRAFSSMFLETELLPERGAVLVHRRPRSASEREIWMMQALLPEGTGFGAAELDSSRESFIGRGGSLARPAALTGRGALAQRAGFVLDPGLALRRRVRLEPDHHARVTLVTGITQSRAAALELLELVATPGAAERAFELAWADARVELRHLGISAASSHRFQRLLSCVFQAPPALRHSSASEVPLRAGRGALWAQGVSGDLPIVLLRIDHPDFGAICRELLLAQEFWRLNGVRTDLVLFNEEPAGYRQPQQDAVLELIRASPAQGRENQPGGVFVLRASLLNGEERELLLRAARVVLLASAGSLSRQLRTAQLPVAMPEQLPVRQAPDLRAREHLDGSETQHRPPTDYFNGIGGFSKDGQEYVLYLLPGTLPPQPWCNVLSNPDFGCVLSESGLGYTWFGNSQRCRLTPWNNDAVCDPSGECLYVRDDDNGDFWSATPLPAGRTATFTVRHGHGYSIFSHTRSELEQELSVLVSPDDPVKLIHLRVQNRGSRVRHLSIFMLVDWLLGVSRETARLHVETACDAQSSMVYAKNPFATRPEAVAFLASSDAAKSLSADREEVLGQGRTRENPAALERQRLSGRGGIGLDPCAAVQVPLLLRPGAEHELCFVLGQGSSLEHARQLVQQHASVRRAHELREEVRERWRSLRAVSVETPDRAFDLMVSHWLPYQVVSARLWARSGFYQSGGAFGFRDQLQDVLSLLHAAPELCREHLLRAARRQFSAGDVQHWWHPETGEGVRTRCSDDLLWLPFVVAAYVRATGDLAVLDEVLPFLQERELEPGEEDLFSAPAAGNESASLYEHCLRAIEHAQSQRGPHDLPLMGSGDWNDGMNRVGIEGRGESVWLAWFSACVLREFAWLAARTGDAARAQTLRADAERLVQAVEKHAWDGAWYRRAYYDDGAPMGSATAEACRIDAIAQSWAVMAGADQGRARRALSSSEEHLLLPSERMMLLLWPPFGEGSRDPGYIRSYPPGIRENGGQYTHGVLWTAQAFCLLGDGERAQRLLAFLNPIHHGDSPAAVRKYRVEPYVLAADVYAAPSHVGSGGWTWYTGSASWYYLIAVEYVLGLRREANKLKLVPCVPPEWAHFRVVYRYGRTQLEILFENPDGASTGVRRIELDGRALEGCELPLIDDGKPHRARVLVGDSSVSEVPAHPVLPRWMPSS